MGGFCGVISKRDCVADLFFGTDYHSHLGTQRGGMVVANEKGFQRAIHNIQNAPFRSKFENDFAKFAGCSGLGVISDTDPQPLIVASHLGTYAIVTVGLIANIDTLMAEMYATRRVQFQYSTTSGVVSPTAVVAALIDSQDSFIDGVRYAQEKIEGSCSLMILTENGRFFAARDRWGRTPIIFGKKEGAIIATQETCIFPNLGYTYLRDLGPGEMVEATPDGLATLLEPGEDTAICSFLWVYWGPMGCLTGFYFIAATDEKIEPRDIEPLIRHAFRHQANYSGDVPGATPVNCGNWQLHDLNMAKWEAKEFLSRKWKFDYPKARRVKSGGMVFFDA